MSKPFDEQNNPLPPDSEQKETGAVPSGAAPEDELQDTEPQLTGFEEADYDYDYSNEEPSFGDSTVFSATPVQDTVKKKGSHRLRNIIAAILVLCIMSGSVLAIVKLIPTDDDDTADESTSSETTSVELVSLSEDEIQYMTVTGASGTYTAYPSESTSSSSTSSGSGLVWNIDGIGSDIIDNSTVSTVVSSATDITASRLMEEDVTDLAYYGLDAPVMTIQVVGYDTDDGYTLYVGDESPTGDGQYVYLKGTDDVYLLASDTISDFDHSNTYFVNKTVLDALEEDTGTASYFDDDDALSSFDSIVVSGSKYTSPITLNMNPYDSGSYIPYIMTTPVKQNVMGDAGDAVLAPVKSGLTADGAYAIYPDAAAIAQYGMDNPLVEVHYTIGTYTADLKIAEVSGDSTYYAVMVDDSPVIYQVAKSSLSFADYGVSDYFNNYIFLDDITTVKSITVTTAMGTHVYDLTHGTDENGDATLAVTCNGNALDDSSFRNLYQYMISCYASEFTMDTATAVSDSTLEIKINYLDDARQDIDAVYIQSSDRRYHVTVNGVPLGYAFATTVQDLISYENGYYKGESVPTP